MFPHTFSNPAFSILLTHVELINKKNPLSSYSFLSSLIRPFLWEGREGERREGKEKFQFMIF
jgi:hypothetical protein